jgi:SAM-dependent methyltransferase
VKNSFLDLVACLYCKEPLHLAEDASWDRKEVMTGALKCASCGRSYPIQDGIPRLLPDELAYEIPEAARAFGSQWQFLSTLQEKNRQELQSYISPLTEEIFQDKVVLDAGCGSGKFAYWVGRHKARQVVGIDLSHSVEVAYRHTRPLANVHIAQADIYHLPFRDSFDVIYSIGVLHHLPRSQEGFQKLVDLLKPGGLILAWVYGREGNFLYITFADPIRKYVTSKLPLSVNVILAKVVAALLWVVVQTVYSPLNRLEASALTRRLPYNDYLMYFEELGFNLFEGTVLDKMTPPVCQYFTRDDFALWFEDAPLTNVHISQRNGNSWTGFGAKRNPERLTL